MAVRWELLLLCATVGVLYLSQYTTACNEALCASMVSKCMLLKSCECNMMDTKNCTCCRDCHRCLAKLYTECCDCVGMCPAKNHKDNYMKTSSVEEIKEPIPELFQLLTEEEDEQHRWTVYTYPAHHDLLYFKPRNDQQNFRVATNEDEGRKVRHFGNHHVTIEPDSEAMNCSVAYFSQCMSLHKCKSSCQSMGAARYRWFHQYGCCECIGSTCLDYGKGESLCLKCPLPEGEKEDEEFYYDNEDEYLYGADDEEDEDDEGEDEDNEGWEDHEDVKGSKHHRKGRKAKLPLSGEEQENLGDDPPQSKLYELVQDELD